jgi:hypothetical protein
MKRRDTDWQIHLARENSSVGYEDYAQEMRRLREQRWDRNERILTQLKGMLPPEILVDIEASITDARITLENARRRGAADDYPGP